jgi:hypothetical protein
MELLSAKHNNLYGEEKVRPDCKAVSSPVVYNTHTQVLRPTCSQPRLRPRPRPPCPDYTCRKSRWILKDPRPFFTLSNSVLVCASKAMPVNGIGYVEETWIETAGKIQECGVEVHLPFIAVKKAVEVFFQMCRVYASSSICYKIMLPHLLICVFIQWDLGLLICVAALVHYDLQNTLIIYIRPFCCSYN